MRRLATLIILLWGGWGQPAHAQRLTDPATGLSVDPPAGYTASRLVPPPPTTANFAVQLRQNSNVGCQLAFNPTPANARFTQEELNAEAGRTAWRDNAIRMLSGTYAIDHSEGFRHAGIEGFLAEGMLRPREGIPPDVLASVRTLFVFLETPNGRTFALCVGEARDFATRRADFIGIVRTTTPDTRQPAAPGGIRP